MKNCRLYTLLRVAFILLGSIVATSVFAQRAALVQSVDEPGRTPYQQEVQVAPVCGSQFCASNFRFSPVPAGKRLVVKNVSMQVQTLAGAAVLPVALSGGSPLVQGTAGLFPIVETFIPITAPPTNSFPCSSATPCVIWGVSQTVDYYVEAGSTPVVVVNVDQGHNANFIVEATLTGYYVSLP